MKPSKLEQLLKALMILLIALGLLLHIGEKNNLFKEKLKAEAPIDSVTEYTVWAGNHTGFYSQQINIDTVRGENQLYIETVYVDNIVDSTCIYRPRAVFRYSHTTSSWEEGTVWDSRCVAK